ncbi:MAG: helix-turn-helix domain-containing protein [Henriciella sp.]
MDEAGSAAPQQGEADRLSAGDRLRAAREGQGLSLKDVATKTLQSPELLEALETMQTSALTPKVVRLYARTYARTLGLPEAEIADGFAPPLEQPATETSLGTPIPPVHRRGVSALVPLAGGGAALALVIWVALILPGPRTTGVQAPVASKVRTLPIRSDIPMNGTAVSGPELGIHALRPAMIEVRASDGTVFRNRRMMAGEVYYPRLGSGWTITVQDAGAFEWRLDDLAVGVLGDSGLPAYGVSVDEALHQSLQSLSDAMAETGETRQTRR